MFCRYPGRDRDRDVGMEQQFDSTGSAASAASACGSSSPGAAVAGGFNSVGVKREVRTSASDLH